MAIPHKCPVCEGSGKLFQSDVASSPFTIPTTAPLPTYYKSCNSCNGTGIVWEPEHLVVGPSYPWPQLIPDSPDVEHIPNAPQFFPFDPVAPLIFDEKEIPKKVRENSRKQLIQTLKKWISDLSKDEDKDEEEFCD